MSVIVERARETYVKQEDWRDRYWRRRHLHEQVHKLTEAGDSGAEIAKSPSSNRRVRVARPA